MPNVRMLIAARLAIQLNDANQHLAPLWRGRRDDAGSGRSSRWHPSVIGCVLAQHFAEDLQRFRIERRRFIELAERLRG